LQDTELDEDQSGGGRTDFTTYQPLLRPLWVQNRRLPHRNAGSPQI